MEMKNGFNFQGANFTLSGGSYGRTNEVLEYGEKFGNFGVYLGANFNYDKVGEIIPIFILKRFSDFRYRPNDNTELFLNIGQANTDLRGNGAMPLSLMDLEGRDAVYTYPDQLIIKIIMQTWVEIISLITTYQFREICIIVIWKEEIIMVTNLKVGDCGLGYNTDRGAADGILCAELEVSGGSDEQVLDVAGNAISYTALGLERDDDENEIEDIGAINRSNTKQNQMGLNFQSTYDSNLFSKNNTLISGVAYEYSHNSFASSTELGIIQSDRGVQGTGVLLSQDEEGENIFITNIEATTHNLALYGSNTLIIDDKTSLKLSGRWNWASLKMEDQYGTALDGHHFFNEFNPGIGVTRKDGYSSVYWKYNIVCYLQRVKQNSLCCRAWLCRPRSTM